LKVDVTTPEKEEVTRDPAVRVGEREERKKSFFWKSLERGGEKRAGSGRNSKRRRGEKKRKDPGRRFERKCVRGAERKKEPSIGRNEVGPRGKRKGGGENGPVPRSRRIRAVGGEGGRRKKVRGVSALRFSERGVGEKGRWFA